MPKLNYIFLTSLLIIIRLTLFCNSSLGKEVLNKDSLQATITFNEGVLAIKNGDYKKAEVLLKKTLTLKQESNKLNEPLSHKIYFCLGATYLKLGNLNLAIQAFEKAESILINQFGGQHPYYTYIYNNLAIAYKENGQYEKAISYYNKALHFQKGGKINTKETASILQNIGVVHLKRKEYNQALDYLHKSLALKENLNHSLTSNTYYYLAKTYYLLNNIEIAEEYYQKLINNKKQLFGDLGTDVGIAFLNYNVFLKKNINQEKGLEYVNKALSIFLKNLGPYHTYTSQSYLELGYYSMIKNNPFKALNYYQKALGGITSNFRDTNIYINPKLSETTQNLEYITILKSKALAFQQLEPNRLKNLEAAVDCLTDAINTIEYLRSGYLYEDTKLFITENEKETYSEIIDVLFKLYQHTGDDNYLKEAFAYSEKSKAANLLGALRRNNSFKIGNLPDSLQQKETFLKADIGRIEKHIYDEKNNSSPDSIRIKNWESELFNLYRNREALISYFEQNYPEYYKIKYNTNVIDIPSIQANLNKDEALVEYSVADSVIYIFTITNNSFKCSSLPVDSTFNNSLNNFLDAISISKSGSYTKKDYDLYVNSAYTIFTKLFEINDPLLTDKHIIIVSDGELNFVPFEALITKLPPSRNYSFKKLDYLLKRNTVSYAYSATILFDNNSGSITENHKVLGIAPTYNFSTDSLLPIEGAFEEINGITEFFECDTFLGSNATEKNFKDIVSKYNILHLAMHSEVNENPLYSNLIFSNNGNSDDRYLYAYEIYNMNFNADLVVLSACNTGRGKLQKGEGVMSLARSFAYAGIKSQLISLWLTHDKSSKEINKEFYKYLAEGKNKAQSLQFAKLDFIQKCSLAEAHPHYWSNLIIIGNIKPLKINHYSSYALILSILFVISCISLFYIQTKKN